MHCALMSVHVVYVETQAGIEHVCWTLGATIPLEAHPVPALPRESWHETSRVWEPVPQVTEHAPHKPVW